VSPRAPLLRVLAGFALLGAGIVNLGLVRGTFPAPAGLLALALGAAETTGAVLLLAGYRPRAVRPTGLGRTAVGVLIVAAAGQVALAVSGGSTLGPAVTAAAALQLAAAGCVGVLSRPTGSPETVRRASAPDAAGAAPSPDHPGRRTAVSLAALLAGALAVASVATFGLSATAAGEHAVPHGEHRLPDLPGTHRHP